MIITLILTLHRLTITRAKVVHDGTGQLNEVLVTIVSCSDTIKAKGKSSCIF